MLIERWVVLFYSFCCGQIKKIGKRFVQNAEEVEGNVHA